MSASAEATVETLKSPVPLMGYGTFIGMEGEDTLPVAERNALVTQSIIEALKCGYRHFDLAEAYSNLDAVGKAFKVAFKSVDEEGLGLERNSIWVTLKSDSTELESIDALISKIGIGYVDTYMLHHPYAYAFDSEEILFRTLQKLSQLPKDLVHSYGVSNCYAPHIDRIIKVCLKNRFDFPISNEVESNPLCPNSNTIKLCQNHNIQVIAYSPLGYNFAGELLTNECFLGIDNPIIALAKELDVKAAQLVLAWHMANGVAVIPKTTKVDRMVENFRALEIVDRLKATPLLCDSFEHIQGMLPTVTETAMHALSCSEALTWTVAMPGKAETLLWRDDEPPKPSALVSGSQYSKK